MMHLNNSIRYKRSFVNINPQSNTDFTQVTCTVHFYYSMRNFKYIITKANVLWKKIQNWSEYFKQNKSLRKPQGKSSPNYLQYNYLHLNLLSNEKAVSVSDLNCYRCLLFLDRKQELKTGWLTWESLPRSSQRIDGNRKIFT